MTDSNEEVQPTPEEVVRAVTRTCRGPLTEAGRNVVNELIERGDLQAAALADAANRQGCGADFNDVILAGPLDGEEHDYACPNCGLTGKYRAPRFEEESE